MLVNYKVLYFHSQKNARSTFVCFTLNKSCLLQSYQLKLNKVGPCLHWPRWWDKWPIDIILPSSSSNTTSWIICTKPKLVMDRCITFQIRPWTIVAWTRYATNCFLSDDYGIAMFHWVSLNCKTMSIQWWWAPFNSPHTMSALMFLNLPSLTIPLDLPTSTFEPMKPLDVVLIIGWEKFTRSCLCELPSNLGPMSTLCFVDPKNSWPSKWGILIMKEDPLVYLATSLAICNGSPD